jgi:HrpA-like RNA helicase
VVGSQLLTVTISQASAKQRAGRAGRVSAGTCYRLYSRRDHDAMEPYTTPEMLRMDLSELVLHSLSLFRPAFGHPLSLIRMAPDPPTDSKLYQTLTGLSSKGLVVGDGPALRLTPLGRAVGAVPASPQLSRMVFLGLAMRALDPALTIAALLSIPKALTGRARDNNQSESQPVDMPCSDLVMHIQAYNEYMYLPPDQRSRHPRRTSFDQVTRVRRQLAAAMDKYVKEYPNENWNQNSDRMGAQASLICTASPYIAHLVSGRSYFATRDVAGDAILHPSSINFDNSMRVHWYTYFELRTTKSPYLHVTTAASPLELALFSDCGFSPSDKEEIEKRLNSLVSNEWMFIADQWVPVAAALTSQRHVIWGLKRWLTYDVLQDVVQNPGRVAADEDAQKLMLYVISAIEQQRMKL